MRPKGNRHSDKRGKSEKIQQEFARVEVCSLADLVSLIALLPISVCAVQFTIRENSFTRR